MSTTAEATQSISTILEARSRFGGSCRVEFTETGYTVISDDRKVKVGYLHVCDDSPETITEACRDQIIRYFFRPIRFDKSADSLPTLGATTQRRYFAGLSIQDIERIGNNGERGFYA